MVAKLLLAFFIFLSFATFAGDFSATVNKTHVNLNENFSLNLTLKDTSPIDPPDVSDLNELFSIHSQQHMTSKTIVNGKVSSSITWKLSLTPKKEGIIEIPPITIETAEGLLSTHPFTIQVDTTSASPKPQEGLTLNAQVNNASPYKNEPIVFTAILTSKQPLYNIQAEKVQVEDAIVELLDEPKFEEKRVGGTLLHVVEYHYLITPLKAGSLNIPSITIQGLIPQRRSHYNSLFDDDFDPFSAMQGFASLKPFTLTTDKIQIDVQNPVVDISPWLPAKALSIEEVWPNNQTLRVGEPFSRSFLIKAQGIKASQLPHLEGLQNQEELFKVYADKPEEQEQFLKEVLHSTRKEHYTLIPKQAGTITLPEITISWWDTTKKEKINTTVPPRILEILPALERASSDEITPVLNIAETAKPKEEPPFLLYFIIAIQTLLLVVALLWGFLLQRKIARLTNQSTPKPKKTPPPPKIVNKEKKQKLPDLNPT